jgi:hypothetical protein
VLGDAAQPAESDGARNRATSGPRHAAPRKSLLTKLHVPAGKAVALAAMPTAVLMGMGFTPHFAQADEMPKSPFKPGPCVSQPDTPSPSSTAKDGSSASSTAHKSATSKSGSTSGSAKSGGTAATPGPSASPSPSPTTTQAPDPVTKAPQKSTTTTAPSPSPSPTKTTNPLDPLGLGNLLGGLLGTKPSPSPTPTTASPSPSTTTAPKPSASPSASPSGSSSDSGTSDTAKKLVGGTTDTVKNTVKKATKGLTDTTKSSGTGSSSKAAKTPLDGSQGYPCPTYDAKALAEATTEGGIPLLPDAPFTLKTTKLTLHGLNYDGIVQVRTWSGQTKDVLKFTATGIDIKDLWQIVEGPHGGHTWVKARAGSTSSFTGGTVTLYTESLSGNLLGLIPVTFTPKAPPPLTLPELFFTNATVVNAGQFGGNLHVPGMQVLPGQP